jgi:poly-gamma-glutamate synthesis protein (capsule biosynthesis protein)
MTGNHMMDWNADSLLYTFKMYEDRGWPYFASGRNLAEARQAITVEHNGNRLAFMGCNPVGPSHAWATETSPGIADCDYEWMHAEIARLKAEGYLPVVTFQYHEYYSPEARPGQAEDFRGMAEAGAVIVSGSQAHTPQTFAFSGSNFIHYGLGNLFFDQMKPPEARQAFIDRHVFYDGRYLGVELITTLLEDSARPRPMTPAERADFLNRIFSLSRWEAE